ncbi:MAG: hypothetical protein F4213_03335 [Boseongicola sp. SB0677_bin_26]|nr:hypothetical protein [Boseongicola sp. SB0665_bin_10]MYG25048.1 hypothetical protein [Boseongicola sp. SB0677_bin_26]
MTSADDVTAELAKACDLLARLREVYGLDLDEAQLDDDDEKRNLWAEVSDMRCRPEGLARSARVMARGSAASCAAVVAQRAGKICAADGQHPDEVSDMLIANVLEGYWAVRGGAN